MSASMGPRSDERGNPAEKAEPAPVPKLQWGRAPMSAEMIVFPIIRLAVVIASMGPRSDERGNPVSIALHMGKKQSLQWGRAPMSAEMG